jgi:RNA polymerase primary sigma factor
MAIPTYIKHLLNDPANAPLDQKREQELADVIVAAKEARHAEAISKRLERNERDAREELVRKNVRLVVAIANGYKHRMDMEDLIGAGNLALVRAVNLWDPSIGPIAPWAIRWIKSSMTRAVDADRTIRIPEELAYNGALVKRAETEIQTLLGRNPDVVELAEATSMPVQEVERLLKLPKVTESTDTPYFGTGAHVGTTVGTPMQHPEDYIDKMDVHDRLMKACKELTEHEALIIVYRFDLAGTGTYPTLSDIGVQIGVSREMIRKMEASALAKLRHPALKVELDDKAF